MKKRFLISCAFFFTLTIHNCLQAKDLPSYSYSEIYIYDSQDLNKNTIDNNDSSGTKVSDPFKVINKNIFNINYFIDSAFFRPISEIYLFTIPKRGRMHIGNVVTNLGEPINFFNLLFQGKFAQARISIGRFIVNSVLGFCGIVDVATSAKMNYKGEDFGQTLGYHKVPNGPYLVVPLLGPTTVRDLTGKVADFFIDPFKYALNKRERNVVNITWLLHKRSNANEVIKTVNNSLDPYETAKLLYIQNREAQISE